MNKLEFVLYEEYEQLKREENDKIIEDSHKQDKLDADLLGITVEELYSKFYKVGSIL